MDTTTMRVAIVGAGPAGFYAAAHLLRAGAEVDVYDRLPTPYGLVRAGVAPDHPKIKNVTKKYAQTAAEPGFRFFGNVEIGTDISREELLAHYHAIIYSVGAATDRRLGIPGEDLPGSHPATDFVAWYNAHPDFAGHGFDLSAERVAVIGNGNVALDVARMLALAAAELDPTDTADHALEGFRSSGVREIVVIGRRGPAQAAFTNPEIIELRDLSAADIVVDPAEAELDPLSAKWLAEEARRSARVNVETIAAYAAQEPKGRPRRIVFRFLRSPVALHGNGRVEAIELERNEIYDAGDGRLAARGTGETETIDVGLVFRSIGYRGVAIPGLPFDERAGTIPHAGGRIVGADGAPVGREYVTGWIKRGPSGVIGTNKKDAAETSEAALADFGVGRLQVPSAEPSADAVQALLDERCPDHVTFAGWEAIDAAERAAGEPDGRPRRKFTTREALLAAWKAMA